MGKILSVLEGIELNRKIDLYERLALAAEIKNEPFDYLKTGCLTLSAAMKIIQKFIENETDPKIFEGAKDQIIALFDKKIADILQIKFKVSKNTAKGIFKEKGQ